MNALTRPVGDKPLAIIMDNVKGSGVRAVEEYCVQPFHDR